MTAISGKISKYLVALTTECTRRFGNARNLCSDRDPFGAVRSAEQQIYAQSVAREKRVGPTIVLNEIPTSLP
ncbi:MULTISPECIES: hypothetical protein [unclassified Rhizobium]|uniref:hypothetical protein n=1 Tax=unclassified Rhizobium TaxID=2613769 RepID=UPI00167E8546|nr:MULTISPECIES: hypothetical protein [unclassified Rhizobium]